MLYAYVLPMLAPLVTAAALWLLWRRQARNELVQSVCLAHMAYVIPEFVFLFLHGKALQLSGIEVAMVALALAATHVPLARLLAKSMGYHRSKYKQIAVFLFFTLIYGWLAGFSHAYLTIGMNFLVIVAGGVFIFVLSTADSRSRWLCTSGLLILALDAFRLLVQVIGNSAIPDEVVLLLRLLALVAFVRAAAAALTPGESTRGTNSAMSTP